MDRLISLLNNVSDTYFDFVIGVSNYAKRSESNLNTMISFIENNPDALSSDIIRYMIDQDNYFDYAERVAGVSTTQQA